MDMLNQKQKIIMIVGIVIIIIVIIFYYINSTKDIYNPTQTNEIVEEIEEEEEISEEEQKIIVHITGAVVNNGIVEVKESARINDVIEAAGGVTDDADLSNVNLAYAVKDGQKIYIPSKNDKEDIEDLKIISDEAGTDIINEGDEVQSSGKVNINTATKEELQTLSGIGESTASKIITYREENGKFKTIEDIKNVPGIGDAKFENIKDKITV